MFTMAEPNDLSPPPPPSVQRVTLATCTSDAAGVLRQAERSGRVEVVDRHGTARIVIRAHVAQPPPFNDD
jgi:hypothetical protein